MSDVIERLPMCPFCELFGQQPQSIGPDFYGAPAHINDLPSCEDCAITAEQMSPADVSRLIEVLDSVRYLRDRGYTVTNDGDRWHAIKGTDALHLSENDFVYVVNYKKFLEEHGAPGKREVQQ